MPKLFSLKIKFEDQRIIDQDFNTVEDMDSAFKKVKTKFQGEK